MKALAKIAILATSLAAVCGVAHAQSGGAPLRHWNFDLWCQEHENLPPDRCDKRLPQDDARFQAFVDQYEGYETQQLNQQAHDRRIDRALQNGDPSSQPAGTPQQQQPITPH